MNTSTEQDKVAFFLPSIGREEEEAVLKVMRSGWLTTGKETLAFEQEFADFIGTEYALAVNSASSGLILAMDACGIKEGAKILTSPYTFASTALAAVHLGAQVEYADIEKDTYSIDPEQIEKKLAQDSSIKAIVPIHIAGNLCNMRHINEIAKHYKVKVIEDAAHAFPAKTKTAYGGSLGDIGVFSFYATKTITTAEGGMICTNKAALAKRMATMRMHGIDRTVWDRYTSNKASWKYNIIEAGYKYNLPDMLAAMGRVQLKRALILFEKRKRIAQIYTEAFKDCDFLECPPDTEGNAWHLYLLRIRSKKLKIGRDEFARILQEGGINISVHFIPYFYFSYFKKTAKLCAADFPHARQQYQATISIPLWPDMTDKMTEKVIAAVIKTGKTHYKG